MNTNKRVKKLLIVGVVFFALMLALAVLVGPIKGVFIPRVHYPGSVPSSEQKVFDVVPLEQRDPIFRPRKDKR